MCALYIRLYPSLYVYLYVSTRYCALYRHLYQQIYVCICIEMCALDVSSYAYRYRPRDTCTPHAHGIHADLLYIERERYICIHVRGIPLRVSQEDIHAYLPVSVHPELQ